MKRKPPTGDSLLARAYRRAATVSILAATPDEARTDYRILAALAARQFWLWEWQRRWGLSRCQAAWKAIEQADLWLSLIERLSKESK